MTIRAGLDDRKVCGQTFELIAIRECEHLLLRICLHLFQRIRFSLSFRKVGFVNRGKPDQAELKILEFGAGRFHKLCGQHDRVIILCPILIRLHARLFGLINDLFDQFPKEPLLPTVPL